MVSVDMSRFNDPSFIDYFRVQIHRLAPQFRSIYYNDAVSIIIEAGKTDADKNNISSLISFLKDNGLYAGCSNQFSDLLEISRYHKQSRKALFFGRLMEPGKRMAAYQNYILHDFIYDASFHLKLKDICHEGVLKLHEYDQLNGTDYHQTLSVYLKMNKNVIAASEALFIHRNTVNYRLEKVKEIFDINLKESEETMHMFMTFKVMEVMDIMTSIEKNRTI